MQFYLVEFVDNDCFTNYFIVFECAFMFVSVCAKNVDSFMRGQSREGIKGIQREQNDSHGSELHQTLRLHENKLFLWIFRVAFYCNCVVPTKLHTMTQIFCTSKVSETW